MTTPSDFQRESYRIDEQIWDALAFRSTDRILFAGVANDGAWIARAKEIGAQVDVICGDNAAIARAEALGATALRGSATLIPAIENAYDVAVAMHYLHEIDPGFHAQVISELARVARRVAIVEPSPPADRLGKRIAALYARAKREAGQFESYQPLDYWRKLLMMGKADVYQSLFTFTRIPPKHAVAETVALILDAMAIEDLPKEYLDELRELAARPDAQLLPLSRIVLVGIGAGTEMPAGSGQPFRPHALANPTPAPTTYTERARTPAAAPPPAGPLQTHNLTAGTWAAPGFGPPQPEEPEYPPPPPPPPPPPKPAARPQPAPPPSNPTPPAPAAAPFGAPFAIPEGEDDDAPFGGIRRNAADRLRLVVGTPGAARPGRADEITTPSRTATASEKSGSDAAPLPRASRARDAARHATRRRPRACGETQPSSPVERGRV